MRVEHPFRRRLGPLGPQGPASGGHSTGCGLGGLQGMTLPLAAWGQCTSGNHMHVPSSRRVTWPEEGAGGRERASGAGVGSVAGTGCAAGVLEAEGTDGTSTVGAAAGADPLLSHPAAKVITNDAARTLLRRRMGR